MTRQAGYEKGCTGYDYPERREFDSMERKKIICIDFDGVLHSYTSGWQGADVATDPPVPGAIEWLVALDRDARFAVCIYSSRSKELGGVKAMRQWLAAHGLPSGPLSRLLFPTQKPAAFLTIDDRAICFDGSFPSVDDIAGFKPWNKKNV